MGIIITILFEVLLVNALFLVDATRNMPFSTYQNHLQRQCSSTKYTSLCVQTLKEFQHGSLQGLDFVSFLVNKTIYDSDMLINNPLSMSSYEEVVSLEYSTNTLPSSSVSESCERFMKMSTKRLRQAIEAINATPRNRRRQTKHDVVTWLSAAMTFQQSCKDSVIDSGLSSSYSSASISHITQKMDYLSRLISNSLSLLDTFMKNPKQKSKSTVRERRLLVGRPHVVVAKDGSGDYRTVMEAVNAAHGNGRFVIYVKSGVYKEKVIIHKDEITLVGEGKDRTVIVGDDSVAGGTPVPDTATMTVTGDGFIGRDIGIKNTAGPSGKQAIALSITSDQSVLYRCSISGYQDTLYAAALRQFYRECDIYGTIDFIFGNAAAVFQSCNIFLRRPNDVKAYNVILANGRTDRRQNTGFALHSCKIRTDLGFSDVKDRYKSYLGRPWKKYSRSIVMETYIDDAIAEEGWAGWLNSGEEVLKTLYFGEFKNYGPKARVTKRVTWQGFHLIGFQEASYFSVGRFIDGVSWLPSTGVNFASGI